METAEKTIESTEEVGAVSMSPSTSLLDILRCDAAGLPITDMLRESARICSGLGGGPLEDRLWLMAEALEPYMSNEKLRDGAPETPASQINATAPFSGAHG